MSAPNPSDPNDETTDTRRGQDAEETAVQDGGGTTEMEATVDAVTIPTAEAPEQVSDGTVDSLSLRQGIPVRNVVEAAGSSSGEKKDERTRLRLEPGTHVGRYLVLECIGAGAMGQVYAAYDPELDRKIALKIMHVGGLASSKGSGKGSDSAQPSPGRRLLREAKALSQLAHPNVVSVFDVGSLVDEVFVAMEFVAGVDLKAWAKQKSRSWQEVLDVYLQAGRGLAAAHAVGLVHRDFKPQNAILGADGRVRVLDFGLAAHRTHVEGEQDAKVLDKVLVRQSSSSDEWERLTQTGALLGTPAYMAPEVIQGKGADDKSDQYGFCVSLFHALHGVLPFSGKTLREIGDAITCGHIVDTHGSNVPGWLRRAVLRGLSADPSKRFPSMDALLLVLERRDPASVRQRWMTRAGAAALGILAVGLTVSWVANRNERMCRGAEKHLAAVWDDARKQAVEKALLGTGVAFAQDTWDRVREGLDAYTSGWVQMHTEACQATHVRGEQSGEMLDLRMRCLRERLGEVKALVDVMSTADREVVEKAAPAIGSLVSLSVCQDEQAMRAAVPPPTDVVARQKVEELRERLDQARALERTGKYAAGTEMVQQIETDARAVGYMPLVAEVMLTRGQLLSGAGKYTEAVDVLEEADVVASQHKHVMASALVERELVNVVGVNLLRLDEGIIYARQAQATLMKAGLFEQLGDQVLSSWGVILDRKGLLAKAIAQLQRALSMCKQASGISHCSSILANLGFTYYNAGKLEEGQAASREFIAIMEKALGPTHPMLGKAMYSLGLLVLAVGKYDEGMQWFTRCHSIYATSLGEDHPLTAEALTGIGNVHWWMKDYAEALKAYQRSLEIRSKVFGADHNHAGTSHINIGAANEGMGNLGKAREHYERALEIKTRTLGPEHAHSLLCMSNIASTLNNEGKLPPAAAMLEKVIDIRTRTLGPNHPSLAESLLSLAEVARKQHDQARERAMLERALQVQQSNHVENNFAVSTLMDLARLLWLTPATRPQAVKHARAAAEMVSRLSGNQEKVRQQITAWLEQHKL